MRVFKNNNTSGSDQYLELNAHSLFCRRLILLLFTSYTNENILEE